MVKNWLKRLVYKAIRSFLLEERANIISNPYISAKLYPLQGIKPHHIVPKKSHGFLAVTNEYLPVPPKELWEGYGETEEEYLSSGRRHVSSMMEILRKAEASPESLHRVLELGSAGARMLRFYPYSQGQSELWGVDISARHITWCQQHLSPPFLFATTTTFPHLPFEDKYFDLVYCGSVFTHITDLADAWFLELRRVLRKGGYAYVTIHDKSTLDLLFTKYKDNKSCREFINMVHRFDKETSILSQDYGSFSFLCDPISQVFYDTPQLIERWSLFAKVLSVTPEAYGCQTAILLQKEK